MVKDTMKTLLDNPLTIITKDRLMREMLIRKGYESVEADEYCNTVIKEIAHLFERNTHES